MAIPVREPAVEVLAYGDGSLGGKGEGLARLNACDIPGVTKLRTRILTTSFFDRFVALGRQLEPEPLAVISSILGDMGDAPVGVRSSATNEAGISSAGIGPVHAGEHASFMLPNNHPDPETRLGQLVQAVRHVYDDFLRKQAPGSAEKMAIVINPIPGLYDDTRAGPCYYPYISGIANSFFPHALKAQDPNDGFARIAFGHGYATVLDDFPVISMATIRDPIPVKFLQSGGGQKYFYALDMTKNRELKGEELETMVKLHVQFANYHKIKLLGLHHNVITIEELVQKNHFGFRSGLVEIMEKIASVTSTPFQIEFVFNIDFGCTDRECGRFHVVQLTLLPRLECEAVDFPDRPARTYVSVRSLQGHGVRTDIQHAVVVSPFLYRKDKHDAVREALARVNHRMRAAREPYILIVPGRLGSRNRDWGLFLEFREVDGAAAIFEYGVDVAGRPEPLPEEEALTGGIYGSHFLYMIQGGFDEERKKAQTRMYGTQGTHFLTNLMCNNIVYGFIAPMHDTIDPWFFRGPNPDEPLYVLEFPRPVSVYADTIHQRCDVVQEEAGRP
ncbi:MAG: hypothetical protein JXQ29_18870 [Planctomycetes bacterium]|nr:hypothetical protein [Planctomycetota bacterium]